jgi:hypothetical protein
VDWSKDLTILPDRMIREKRPIRAECTIDPVDPGDDPNEGTCLSWADSA